MTRANRRHSFARLTSLGLGIALAASPSFSLAAALAPLRRTLPNGLDVLLLPEPDRDIASIQIWYRVGLPEEDAETAGFAHLLEHLMFTGTAANADFRAAVAALGGRTFSGTREDLTYFASDLPRSAVAGTLALEADRMRGLTLPPGSIEKSLRDVEIEEAAAAARWGGEGTIRAAREAAFAGHPYGAPSRAPAAGMATLERCRAFYERYYGPDRACLVVAGGFEPDSVLAAVNAHFAELAPTGNPRAPLPAPAAPEESRRTVRAPGLSGPPWIALGYRTPGPGTPEGNAMPLLESLLNLDAADSLSAALLPPGEGALALPVTAQWLSYEGAGLMTVMAPLPPGADGDRALGQLARAIDRRARSAIDPQGFATLRDRTRLAQAASAATVRDRAAALALAHLRSGQLRTVAGTDSLLAAVEPSALTRAASAFLGSEKAVEIQILPGDAR